ncbi:hypothetical protein BAE44_0006485 [Dichanthelium oligosanthes]|uniref:Uncharacterized protein n=1 Tax=Dichanthelium oligosanthes TaxID=888268 RepID=A0A1E5W511_9POAL|nr:hypothetical protein BAE44_0006485 [Dichanthelium oligosanthes]
MSTSSSIRCWHTCSCRRWWWPRLATTSGCRSLARTSSAARSTWRGVVLIPRVPCAVCQHAHLHGQSVWQD